MASGVALPMSRALNQAWAFTSSIQGVQQLYTAEHLALLEACGAVLGKAKLEPRLNPQTIDDLRKQVQELHDAILEASDVPADLRSFMLDHLDHILRAIREVALRGPAALTEAVDQAVGSYVTRGLVHRESTNDPAAKNWVDQFKKVVASVAAVVSVLGAALALPAAAEEAAKVLTSAEDPVPTTTIVLEPWSSDPIEPPQDQTGEAAAG